jgi:hypothetical protein
MKSYITRKNLYICGGVVAAGALGFAAAPAVAAFAGSMGLLGAAGTGTAIHTLSGAALTSASLSAVGSGTVVSGKVMIAIHAGNIARKAAKSFLSFD